MLGVGFTELVVIGLVALLVMGPEELPRLMRQAGRTYGQLRRTADNLRRAFMLEADRQDASERYAALLARRQAAAEAKAQATALGGTAQAPALPGVPSDLAEPSAPRDIEVLPPGHEDPETPAPPRRDPP